MVTQSTRVYAARLAGTAVFAPNGDQLGVARDVVCLLRMEPEPPIVVGLVVEVGGRRRIFIPMTRVTDMQPGAVVVTGQANLRSFAQRQSETLVVAELLDRKGVLVETGEEVKVLDAGMELRNREWLITRLHVRKGRSGLRRRAQTLGVDWHDVRGLVAVDGEQDVDALLDSTVDMHPADVATLLATLPAKRRIEVARALPDERLADVIGEMGDAAALEIFAVLDMERAADILEEMDPDDAADLLAELPADRIAALLELVEPDEAEDLRRLLVYDDGTAGGLMNPEPIILPPDATVAQALAAIRNPDLSPSLAAQVYIVRPPLETPTGRFLGTAHFQRLLREPPGSLVLEVSERDLQPLRPELGLPDITRSFATYDLVAMPVVDSAHHLLGAVTVDDVIDHMLPDDWREKPNDNAGEVDTSSTTDKANYDVEEVR